MIVKLKRAIMRNSVRVIVTEVYADVNHLGEFNKGDHSVDMTVGGGRLRYNDIISLKIWP